MPASSIATNVRAALETAISSVAANVYDVVPESPIPPFAAIVPISPYMEIESVGRSTVRVKLNYAISCGVAYFSNAASLDNLEKLIIGMLAAMPAGYVVGVVEKPTVLEVGQSPMLVADINVSTYYTQTN